MHAPRLVSAVSECVTTQQDYPPLLPPPPPRPAANYSSTTVERAIRARFRDENFMTRIRNVLLFARSKLYTENGMAVIK